MTVFLNITKRIMKSKLQFLAILIVPAIFLIMISLSSKSEINDLKLGIIDNDKTQYTSKLTDNLKDKATFVNVNESDIKDYILNSKLDYALVINKDFTNDLIQGKEVQPTGYFLKESVRSYPLQKYVEDYIEASKTIAKASQGEEAKFYKGLEYFKNGINLNFVPIKEIDRNRSYLTLGMMLMFMMMSSVFFTTLILSDKENKTFYRSISAPITLINYMLQTVSAFFIICTIQVTFIFIALKVVVGIYLGDSILQMYILFMLISLICVSMGVAISSVSKSVVQACFTGLLIILPMTFLGGCWWKNAMSPDLIRLVGRFTPTYWVMESINKLLNGQNISSIAGEILIILIFVTVFFFFGTWRREDIAN